MNSLQQYRKYFVALAAVIFIAVSIVSGLTINQRAGKIAVTINTLPSDSRVTLNTMAVSSTTQYLAPGTYVVVAQKEGFARYEKTIVVSDTANKQLNIGLVPISETAKDWVAKNKEKYANFASADQAYEQNRISQLKEKNPITSNLPYKNLLYDIRYRADESDISGARIIIEINASEAYRSAALFQIRKWGYDPTDFRIDFNDYTNPITS